MPIKVHVPHVPSSVFLEPVADGSDDDFIVISEEEGTSMIIESVTFEGRMTMKDGLTHKVRLVTNTRDHVGTIEDLGLHRRVIDINRSTA